MRKTTLFVVALAFFMRALKPGSASAAPREPAAEPSAEASAETLALVFDLQSLVAVASPYDDGYQSGIGAKWWAKETLAVRGLASLELNAQDGQTTSALGLSAIGEWHPSRRPAVSPYAGALVGLRATMDGENRVDLYAGALGGLELRLFGPVAMYAEYRFIASLDAAGFTLSLGDSGSARLGLLFYF